MGALAIGILALVGWAVFAIGASDAALQGWHIAFVLWSGPGIGAMALLLIHKLTGGRWGAGFAPELEPAAATVPLFCLLVLPILIGAPEVFRWAADPASVTPSVHRWFLNPGLYAVRSGIALVGWSFIAWRLARFSRLAAGVALAFYGVTASVMSVDWVLSVEPSWPSSNFPMAFVTQQLALALAWAALQGRKRPAVGPLADVDGLLFATLLGLSYLQFMDYLVVWYGDRPSQDAWYLSRAADPWREWLWGALIIGALVPTVLFMLRHKLGRHRATRLAGLSVFLGAVLYDTWLMAPASGPACLLPGALAVVGIGGVWTALAGGVPRLAGRAGEPAHV
jgi:hypothetical protein